MFTMKKINPSAVKRTQLCTSWGTVINYYTDDDGGSGYGDNPLVAEWWGDIKDAPLVPNAGDWHSPDYDGVDPLSLALERRYDYA